MAKTLFEGRYARLVQTFGREWMPVVRAKFTPRFQGQAYEPRDAVLDSGSEVTWVPYGVAKELDWAPVSLDPAPAHGLTGSTETLVFAITVELGPFTRELRVWELPQTSRFKYTMIGQDLLKFLLIVLSGGERRLKVMHKMM